MSSDKGGSYACYSPIRPVSHTRAGGEEEGRAKDFHTKGNKQVHLLATNQSGGFRANINVREKGRKINKRGIYCAEVQLWGKIRRMLATQRPASAKLEVKRPSRYSDSNASAVAETNL